MKKLKQIFNEVKSGSAHNPEELNNLLWQLICYSPKMPVRLQQQQLLDEAEKFTLTVNDEHFAKRELSFNGFKWGSGKYKLLITHGWGSKAADFTEMIMALRDIDDLQIIAFDAPGNGSSEGELSNLLLYIKAVKAIIAQYGVPDIFIGHSLGGMANIMAVQETDSKPALIISITPLIRLKENFEASMTAADVSREDQDSFLRSFEVHFHAPASKYNLKELYDFTGKHWLAYDELDAISPYTFMEEFINTHPNIDTHNYEGVGHERIIKSPELIDNVVELVKMTVNIK